MKNTGKQAQQPSLRFSIILILVIAIVIFTMLFISISRIFMPNILVQAEDNFLLDQGRIARDIFRAACDKTIAMNGEIAVWDDMFYFVNGENPDFIAKNWPDVLPPERYSINHFIVKDRNGDNMYSSGYDYINNTPISISGEFFDCIAPFCRAVITQHESKNAQEKAGPISNFGNHGILFFKGLPYFVSIMPITQSQNTDVARGTLVFVNLLNNEYFSSITHFKDTRFQINSAVGSSQTQPSILRFGGEGDKVLVLIPVLDFQGNTAVLSVEPGRASLPGGKRYLDMIALSLIFGFILFAALLYFITSNYFITPLEHLTSAICKITSNKKLEVNKYSSSTEFGILSSSINSMLEKLQQSSISTDSFKKILNEIGAFLYVVDIETFEVLFVNDLVSTHYHIDNVIGKFCWEVFQRDFDGICLNCPVNQLREAPNKPVVWEEFSGITKRYYKNTSSIFEWRSGKTAMLQHKVDITDLRLAEASQRKRLIQQEILAAVSNTFIASENINNLINNALAIIGSYLNVSRMVLAKVHDGVLNFDCDWYNPAQAVERLAANRSVPFVAGEVSYNAFITRGESYFYVCDISADEKMAKMYEPLGIKAIFSVPIIVYSQIWGILTADECLGTHDWDENDIQFMNLIANSFSDLIIRNIAEQETLAAKDAAEQSSQAKTMFLARMSHEMRTPLNAIIGMTTIAQFSREDSGKVTDCLAKITEASIHLKGVIDDVLDMSKIEAGKFFLIPREFVFEMMVRNIVDKMNFKFDEKRQNLIVELDKEIPFSIICDELRLSQVVSHFLSNAIKFTPRGGQITLAVKKIAEENNYCTLLISVADNGIGISGEQQKRLFVLFEQADGGTARRYAGAGIGLAMSKHIVDLMGGKIWVESSLGKGAEFFVEVRVERGRQRNVDAISLHLAHLHILAVDDSDDVLEYFDNFAKAVGLSCEVASDGNKAYSLVQENIDAGTPFDIIFVDWRMPGMNGIELTKKIKELGAKSVVIMISAAEWNAIESDAKQAGVDGFVSKPLFPSALIDSIASHLAIDRTDQAEAPPDGKKAAVFAGKNILLVEDVEINQDIVIGLLEDTGVAIDCTGNGLEAIKKFQDNPQKYDIILMDIHMPEMDGYDATRHIRHLDVGKSKDIPIMAMTANVFKEDVDRCLACGMNDHIGKPIDFDELIAKLKKHLRVR
jgi:signal transduction histidine kinase/DNA-binding response OmpR family regulator/sensor domain CHASE-containing protein